MLDNARSKVDLRKNMALWLLLIVLGIIGTIISMLVIPISPIPIVLGLLSLVTGIIMHYSLLNMKTNFSTEDSKTQNNYFGFALIFIGFTLAWLIAWFIFVCYFRYSTYMFTIYL